LTISGAQIGSGLSLLGTEISSLDLTGAKISGDLEIGPLMAEDGTSWPTTWPDNGSLILSRASVNVLKVALQSWPGLEIKSEIKLPIIPCPVLRSSLRSNSDGGSSIYDLIGSSYDLLR
jgi:hypothetical protein